MLTGEGQRQKSALLSAQQNAHQILLNRLKPLVEQIPKVVRERVVKTGAGGNGNSFLTPYSIGWAKRRKARGRQVNKRDFQYSGSMWDSFGIIEESTTDSGVQFILAMSGQNEDSRRSNDFLAHEHSKNEGQSIIAMNKSEEEEFTKKATQVVADYIRTIL